ncbi:MAG TPA: hypothetical protein VF763_05390 [Candidatus Limnocylindrales bacterium]
MHACPRAPRNGARSSAVRRLGWTASSALLLLALVGPAAGSALAAAPGANGKGTPIGGQTSHATLGGSVPAAADSATMGSAEIWCAAGQVGRIWGSFTLGRTLDASSSIVVYLVPNTGSDAPAATVSANYIQVSLATQHTAGSRVDWSIAVTSPFDGTKGGVLGVFAVNVDGRTAIGSSKTNSLNCSESTATPAPAGTPVAAPTTAPTTEPTQPPTTVPTVEPTEAPTAEPTTAPTTESTEAPTTEPTEAPTTEPTEVPTLEPTTAPTTQPTVEPTTAPTTEPTEAPRVEPTQASVATSSTEPTTEPVQPSTAVDSTATPTEDVLAEGGAPVSPTLPGQAVAVDSASPAYTQQVLGAVGTPNVTPPTTATVAPAASAGTGTWRPLLVGLAGLLALLLVLTPTEVRRRR